MRYLITGGAGFIGSHIAEHLCQMNESVRVLDNLSTGKFTNIEGLPLEFVEGDFCDSATLAAALDGIDVVFHEGALCSVARSIANPEDTHRNNATGTLTVLDGCRKAKVKRLVFASSSSVYGDIEALPKFEGMREQPISPYAVSKLIGEYYCRIFTETYGLPTVALRYFNVFGPKQDPHSEYAAVIPRFVDAILEGRPPIVFGNGEQSRDFTYVDNVVHANLLAATRVQAVGHAFNVGCGDRFSLVSLLEQLGEILDRRISPVFQAPRAGDVAHSQASIRKANQLMGYEPVMSFREGLERTVAWYLDQHAPVTSLREATAR